MEKNITLRLTARLFAEEKCFGPGVARLLEAVDELHSLRSAAQSMNMAYSKAWAIVHGAEQGFGCKLLRSTIGGAGGGVLAGLLFRKVPARLLHLILGGVILAGGVRLLVC